jgi:hypothetical protein
MRFAAVLLLVSVSGVQAQSGHGTHQHMQADTAASKPAVPASQAATVAGCGANFTSAMNMVNAAMRAGTSLPPNATVSRSEIDALLGMAISIAHREAPCVRSQLKGPAGYSYDASYSKMLQGAASYAQARKLPQSVVAQAKEASLLLSR